MKKTVNLPPLAHFIAHDYLNATLLKNPLGLNSNTIKFISDNIDLINYKELPNETELQVYKINEDFYISFSEFCNRFQNDMFTYMTNYSYVGEQINLAPTVLKSIVTNDFGVATIVPISTTLIKITKYII